MTIRSSSSARVVANVYEGGNIIIFNHYHFALVGNIDEYTESITNQWLLMLGNGFARWEGMFPRIA